MPETQERRVPVFRREIKGLAYADIGPIRAALSYFLDDAGIPKTESGKYLLTLTEVLTNLLRHPQRKPENAVVEFETGANGTRFDIADDGAPFADFDKKCRESLARPDAQKCFCENGYGLACILRQHAGVSYLPAQLSPDGLNHFVIVDPAGTGREFSKKKTVFLVDDDPVVLKIQARMLEKLYDVVSFADGQGAVDSFPLLRPDLIISDLVMPGMDGADLRRALTRIDGGSETPFVFLSSVAEKRHAPSLGALGIDDFICKPVTQEHLLAVTERLLKRSTQVRDALNGRISASLTGLLTPTLPAALGPWRMALRNIPAEAGGGDFILGHPTPDGMFALLADVMGHGPMAKFFAYTYAGYLRSLCRMMERPDPKLFFDRLSACATGDPFLESMFMTCQIFRLSEGGRMGIVSAGHPPPILVNAAGAADIPVYGPLPGLAGGGLHEPKEVSLSKGDKVLLATDGFFCAFDRAGFAHEDLYPLLAHSRAQTAEETVAALWLEFGARLERLSGMRDDATVVVIEYVGE